MDKGISIFKIFLNISTALKHKINQLSTDLQSEATTFLIKDCNILLKHGEVMQNEEMSICADVVNLIDSTGQELSSPDNSKSKSKKSNQKSGDKTSAAEKVNLHT